MDIIRKLRIQIVVGIVVIQTVLLATILIALIGFVSKREVRKSVEFLDTIVENNGHYPKSSISSAEVQQEFVGNVKKGIFPIEINIDDNLRSYFSIRIRPDGEIYEVISDFPLSFTRDEISAFVDIILENCKIKVGENFSEKRKVYGESDNVIYFILNKSDGSKLVSVMDMSGKLMSIRNLIKLSLFVFIVMILVSLIVSTILSIMMVHPVKTAFLKQRQFVADAGHELKTPIAVIGANLDVLMPDMPDNRWLNYIKTENERMGHLVKNLLYLARNDADRLEVHFSVFDFSSAVKNAVLPFESVAFEDMKHLELDIEDEINVVGDEQQLKQIAIILVDNAIKNSDADALIRVTAKSDKDNVVLKVFNTGHGIKKDDLEKIFLRFYRSDSSRARKTGGYGLGLAIARTIAEMHHGTLTADSEEGNWAEFTLVLPLNYTKTPKIFRAFSFFHKSMSSK